MVEGKPETQGDSGVGSNESTPEVLTPPPASAVNNLMTEASLTLKIQSPGSEPFDMQVGSGELVQEIHQVLLDREETCHRTCFSLYLGQTLLDNFAEIRSIKGMEDGATVKVQEEPYTVREARVHLRHLRDLVRSMDTSDALNGLECASLSYLAPLTAISPNYPPRPTVPDFVLPGTKDRPLIPLHPPFGLPDNESDGVNGNGKETNGESNGTENGSNGNVGKHIGGCYRKLGVSGWNPPQGNRKLHGDLLYLYVLTIEEKRYHITCSTRGFFVNQSSSEAFDPRPAHPKQLFHSLVELIAHLSPAFKRNFAVIQKRRCSRHIFERLPTPYQVHTWAAPQPDLPSWDPIRAEDATQSHRLGFEDHIPGQIRDWNEELQTTRELPRGSQGERLVRERATFKIHSDFVAAAVKGACAVVDGNVMAINPGDESKMQMFIWNNIFFSLGFDVKDHYADLGGDAAAFVAPTNDLQGVRAYFNLDQEKLYTLGTVIVDYRGLRVTAQSIIPGILEREQEQSVVYGSIDFGKTVVTSDLYKTLMEKPAAQLKIAPHVLKSVDGSTATLYSSAETKGIIGNDGRAYILDLLRTFPPDINYLPGSDVSDVCRANGFPRPFPHKLASLRQELVDAFVEARYLMFIKIAAFNLQKMRYLKAEKEDGAKVEEDGENTPVIEIEKDGKSKTETGSRKTGVHNIHLAGCSTDAEPRADALGLLDGDLVNGLGSETGAGEAIAAEVKRKIVASSTGQSSVRSRSPTPETGKIGAEAEMEAKRLINGTEAEATSEEAGTAEIIAKAARCVSSLSEQEFSIRFNPDAFCPTVTHADDEADLAKHRKLIKEAAHFLLVTQIPNLVRDCLDHSLTPVDGAGLSEAMHSRGINIRYLGKVASYIEDIPCLAYLSVLCQTELVARSAKHVWRGWIQGVEAGASASAVAHFLNCLLSSVPSPVAPTNLFAADQLHLIRKGVTKAARRKTKTNSKDESKETTPWGALTPKSLWEAIVSEAESYYGITLEVDGIDSFVAKSRVQRVSLLRRFAICVGIQIQLRDYALDSKTRAPFGDEDILNLFPVVKHLNPRATDASILYQSGQNKISNGQLREGYVLVNEALNLLNNVYGAMHPEIAQCLRLLARLAYILGDHQEALAQQHKAVLMSERCSGLDHPHTILEYMHLALYAFANLQIPSALRLLYRSRYLLLIAHGEEHPQMALIDSNLGLILHACQEYEQALKFLQHANTLHTHYYGAQSLKTALSHHLVASAHSARGDFRSALAAEKEAFGVYRQTLGETHEKTLESGEILRQLTAQAVSFQKKINEIAKAPASALGSATMASLLPLHQPSLQQVLEMLNLVNGIVFVQISPSQLQAWRAQAESSLTSNPVIDFSDSSVTAPSIPLD